MQALNDRLRGARLAQSLEASGHGHTGMVGIVIGFKPMISGELAKFCVQVYILNVALVNFFLIMAKLTCTSVYSHPYIYIYFLFPILELLILYVSYHLTTRLSLSNPNFYNFLYFNFSCPMYFIIFKQC